MAGLGSSYFLLDELVLYVIHGLATLVEAVDVEVGEVRRRLIQVVV